MDDGLIHVVAHHNSKPGPGWVIDFEDLDVANQ